jgi:DUF1680 family protein
VDEGAHHHGTAGDPPLLLDLMGCCPPEGMRALRTVWRHTVTARPEGIFVNMALPCRQEEAEVATGPGSVTVTARQDAVYFLRPPGWAPRAEVRLYHAGSEITPEWRGDYVRTPRLRRGEEVSLVYPLVSFVQEQEVQAGANSGRYRITWRGHDVVGIDPQGRRLPLFTERTLPPPP